MILNMKPPPGETPTEPLAPEEEYLIEYLAFSLLLVFIAVFGAACLSAVQAWVG